MLQKKEKKGKQLFEFCILWFYD